MSDLFHETVLKHNERLERLYRSILVFSNGCNETVIWRLPSLSTVFQSYHDGLDLFTFSKQALMNF